MTIPCFDNAPRPRTVNRLAVLLTLSGLLHVAVFLLMPYPQGAPRFRSPPLQITLQHPLTDATRRAAGAQRQVAAALTDVAEKASRSATAAPAHAGGRDDARVALTAGRPTAADHGAIRVEPDATAPVNANIPSVAPAPNAGDTQLSRESILDAAREIARASERHEAQYRQKGALNPAGSGGADHQTTPREERPFMPELDKAIARGSPPAGSTQLADGTIKVVSAAGTVYCLPAPPSASVSPALRIPTTCP